MYKFIEYEVGGKNICINIDNIVYFERHSITSTIFTIHGGVCIVNRTYEEVKNDLIKCHQKNIYKKD